MSEEIILVPRESEPPGYYYATKGSRKFSVVDFGVTMKSLPKEIYENIFHAWESIELDKDGSLTENLQRADSWEELKKIL